MESAVEAILVMEAQAQAPAPAPRNIPAQDNVYMNFSVPNDYSSQRPRQQQQNYRTAPARDSRNYRGTLCDLPNDFLRPPSTYRSNNMNMNDEELALMLQNELFQREAFAALGSDMRGIQPTGQYRSGRENMYGSRMQNSQSQQPEGIPDMGILKGLSTMSAAAKAKLAELAERFQNSSSANNSGSGIFRNKVQVVSERERQTEMRRLMDDNDEEDEVIDFGSSNNSRGQHSLNDNSRTIRKKDD